MALTVDDVKENDLNIMEEQSGNFHRSKKKRPGLPILRKIWV